jgi:hypothetical protein
VAVEVLERRLVLAPALQVGLSFTGSNYTDFGGPSVPDANAVDPRIIYDHASGRWFASALDRLDFYLRTIIVGVSNSSNPTAGWKAYKIDPDPSNHYFADFPTLGVDGGGIYINASMHDIPNDGFTPNPSSAVTIISIPKADLTAATPTVANATVFPNIDPNASNSNPFTWAQPVIDFGPYDGREPMMYVSGGGVVRTDVGAVSATNGGTVIPGSGIGILRHFSVYK